MSRIATVRRVVGMILLVAGLVPSVAGAADSDAAIVAKIDQLVRQGWDDNGVRPSPRAEDGEFARRAALDIVGRIPQYEPLMELLDSDAADKRAAYVDRLLDDPDYVRNWTNIWANLLVGRANRRGNRDALERWLRGAFRENRPYDRMVRELIAAEGDSDRNGAVAFLASHLNDQARPATSITSRVFLGMQVQCTECHNHPFNDWKQDQYWGLNAFFRGTRAQRSGETVTLTDQPFAGDVYYENRRGLLMMARPAFLDGRRAAAGGASARQQLADLIVDPSQPYLARAVVNRMWGHFFGCGFTRPVDDMGPHNRPSHPELLDYLAGQFRESGYDLKRLIRWITQSEAYHLTSRFGEANAADDPSGGNAPLFSRVYLKQFRAEQLYDSLLTATQADQAGRNYDEAERKRREWLRQFVQTFGTDENDEMTTFNGTVPQALVLMNGELVRSALDGSQGSFLRRLVETRDGDVRERPRSRRPVRTPAASLRNLYRGIPQKIDTLFVVALARHPTDAEMDRFNTIYRDAGYRDPITGLQDVFWAILNSNEFITNH